ncbi:cryptococcal mannosyltransferase 1-domain-containing protein [Aspergillus granulosus]|uniref:Cryptococcal mannosyltransferase 1-domain-containing protein n=1 Tax=Aspergillus granulosus TaxID=176169 RepID=A0ABR4HFC2_9EURO
MSGHTLLSNLNSPDMRSSLDSQDSIEYYKPESLMGERSVLLNLLHQIYSLPRNLSRRYRRGNYYSPLIPTLVRPPRHFRRFLLQIPYYVIILLSTMLFLVLASSVFCPSYTNLPLHYGSLRNAVIHSDSPGRGNPYSERIFIAAALYDPSGDLAQGHWGSSILQLIHLLGEDNVFLSIYENDSGDAGKTALQTLEQQVKCNSSIVYEDHLDLLQFPQVTTPSGDERVKRIVYLAEARNRVLKPLDKPVARFNRVLFLNDVAFDPLDALQLLFSTNLDPENDHKPQYRAACAVDFINPFKFYDTYATRDLEGYSMGLPFFPWFSDSGSGQSRKDVLAGKDAVPVRSCWGGMVAFDAQFFQPGERVPGVEVAGPSLPARFRALQDVDLFWDASECCLIHADIQAPRGDAAEIPETGIYINPFVRVAYDTRTLSWLWTTRRFEKLYSIIHNVGNHLVGLPWFNPRREEVPGQSVQDTVYISGKNGAGSFQTVERIARHDGFCGRQGLQIIVPREGGKKGWKTIPMPAQNLG